MASAERTCVGYGLFTNLVAAKAVADDAPNSGTAYSALTYNGKTVRPLHARIQAQDGDVRHFEHGGTPTGTIGILLEENTTDFIENSPDDIRRLQLIEATGGAAALVIYYI